MKIIRTVNLFALIICAEVRAIDSVMESSINLAYVDLTDSLSLNHPKIDSLPRVAPSNNSVESFWHQTMYHLRKFNEEVSENFNLFLKAYE